MEQDKQSCERREKLFNGIADACYALSLASIAGSLALMIRAWNSSGEERERMQHLSLFVGQWPPTFAIFGRIFAAQTTRPELPFAPSRESQYGGRLSEVR